MDTRESTPDTDTEGEGTVHASASKWIQDCQLAISPTADLIAISNKDKLVLMTPKYKADKDADDEVTRYCTVWSGSVAQNTSEFVTSLLCLPLASQKMSTQGAPDWTCVLVGLSSGFVRIYTETGALLLSQKLHTEPVQRLKCNTYTPRRYLGIAEQHEELLILYVTALVTIDGFSLYQALKACRNQVARATASGEASLQPPPLAYKKWAPQDMETIVDMHTTGVHTPNPFDQMVLASIVSHKNSIRPAPPAASVYLLAGIGPYTGFFYAIEGSAQPILSEVAFAVASKLKSAIMSAASGWLSFGSKGKSETSGEKQPKIEPATPLPLRFGLPDQRREGLCVSLSPNNTYAVTTDSFGRVILIDIAQGIAIRMWKGYRDATVGWVEVKEEEESHSHVRQCRSAQFLVIYASRRGILEIWLAGNGPRVAAFNVSKHCQLVSISHGILGLNNVTSKGVRIKAFQVALLDPAGTLKTVQVPFHLALSDKNNKRVRDMHLLKRLKEILRENKEESESLAAQVQDLLLNIKICSIAQQGVDKILSTPYLSAKFMLGILAAIVQRLKNIGENHRDIERRLFLQYCQLQERLIQTYIELSTLQSTTQAVEQHTQTLSTLLGLSDSEVEHMNAQASRYHGIPAASRGGARVTFKEDGVTNVADFLFCFACTPHAGESATSGPGTVALAKDLTDEKTLQLGRLMFEPCLKYQTPTTDLFTAIRNCLVPTEDLASLLVCSWLQDNTRTASQVPGLFYMLKLMVSSLDGKDLSSDRGEESHRWQSLHHLCCQTTKCLSAYLAAIVTKSVVMDTWGLMPKKPDKPLSDDAAKDPDADTMSICSETLPSPVLESSPLTASAEGGMKTPADVEAWTLLAQQLEDLLCIDCFLKLSPPGHKQVVNLTEEIKVSVLTVLEGGKGCISEVVARHIARVGFQPQDLYRPLQEEACREAGSHSNVSSQEIVWDQMELLKRRFPHSLENDVLFSNSSWEYAVLWNKVPEEVNNLKHALDFLRLVQNAMLRQGVCSMMWHMFISKRFQAIGQLMEKVGKVPKDRLCRKEIGISETRLGTFVSQICDFFNIIMDANCETNEVPVFNHEPSWTEVKGSVSLVELAIDQKSTNYGLLTVFNQLSTIIHAVVTFNIKQVKVLSLFDTKGRHALSQELHAHPLLPTTSVDSSVAALRKQFLTRVITESVKKMREFCPVSSSDNAGSPSSVSVSKLRSSEAGRWPGTILDLADQFGLDLDQLKQHQVCELYSAGFDKLAEEVLVTVNDRQSLGAQLLTICGQRVAYKLAGMDAQMMVDLMSNVNPALSTWLKAMNAGLLLQADVETSYIQNLIHQTLIHLSEDHPLHGIAQALESLSHVL
ncbi:rab3 GTPase-activating protein non-catalytic subunit-like isoform X3 [Dreissena polymorpha]|nr:rab3 GTPase-activating protein non-catalytic subunit-like isoform X3 [Dreissena polymorpha]